MKKFLHRIFSNTLREMDFSYFIKLKDRRGSALSNYEPNGIPSGSESNRKNDTTITFPST